MFTSGKKPGPTDRNHHHVLSWRLAPLGGNKDSQTGYVFCDIAGEQATQEQREGTINPIVFNSLSRADIVMVFLILILTASFRRDSSPARTLHYFELFEEARKAAQTARMVNKQETPADQQAPVQEGAPMSASCAWERGETHLNEVVSDTATAANEQNELTKRTLPTSTSFNS